MEKKLCKKIRFKADNEIITVLFGLIIKEDINFYHFKTANKTYMINKICVLSLEDTTRIFQGVLE